MVESWSWSDRVLKKKEEGEVVSGRMIRASGEIIIVIMINDSDPHLDEVCSGFVTYRRRN